MESPIKTPEQLLAYRPLEQVLANKPTGAYSVAPDDSVYRALELMADKSIGFVVVIDGDRLVGVLSERDYARKVILLGRSSKDTKVGDIMTRKVVSVSPQHTIPQCMALMSEGGFRHLPVIDVGRVIGVLSIRDILKEIIAHHERLIRNLELERMTILNPGTSSY